MATQYAYDKYVLQSTQNIFALGGKLARKDDPESWYAHISYIRFIMSMPPRWGKITKKRAELMNEFRSYWKNKWFNETIPEIKKVILETTFLPEDVVNMLQEYYQYPYQTKPAYVGRVRWVQDINGIWHRYDDLEEVLDELWKDQQAEWQRQAYLGGLYFREGMERVKEHRAARASLRRQVDALVSKRAKGWDGVERRAVSGGDITHRRWYHGRRHGRGRRPRGRRGGGGGGAVHVGLKN